MLFNIFILKYKRKTWWCICLYQVPWQLHWHKQEPQHWLYTNSVVLLHYLRFGKILWAALWRRYWSVANATLGDRSSVLWNPQILILCNSMLRIMRTAFIGSIQNQWQLMHFLFLNRSEEAGENRKCNKAKYCQNCLVKVLPISVNDMWISCA